MDIEQHCTGRVGVIGDMYLSLCHLPDQPRLHRSEIEIASLRPLAHARNFI